MFDPTATGTQNAALTVTTAAGAQALPLTGSGSDFALNWAGDLPAATTVNAGSRTTYNLSLSNLGGSSQTIQLSCQADAGFTCSVSTASVTLGSQTVPFTLQLLAPASAGAMPLPLSNGGGSGRPWAAEILLAMALLLLAAGVRSRRKLSLAGLALLVVMSAACAGTGPVASPSVHHVTVTAVSSTGSTHAKTLDLRVE